jgi:hypothetical protein
MGDTDVLPYKVCPTCNHTAVELLPLSKDEHYHFEYTATELFWNLDEKIPSII